MIFYFKLTAITSDTYITSEERLWLQFGMTAYEGSKYVTLRPTLIWGVTRESVIQNLTSIWPIKVDYRKLIVSICPSMMMWYELLLFNTAYQNLAFNLGLTGNSETKIRCQTDQSASKNFGFPIPRVEEDSVKSSTQKACSIAFWYSQRTDALCAMQNYN